MINLNNIFVNILVHFVYAIIINVTFRYIECIYRRDTDERTKAPLPPSDIDM